MAWGRVDVLVLDVDGVLTDGGLYFGPGGEALKRFDVQDGQAIVRWRRSGGEVLLLSGRDHSTIGQRARELGISAVLTGQAAKGDALAAWRRSGGRQGSALGCVCDDWADLPVMRLCDFRAAVRNATPAVKRQADYVTRKTGGHGAVAEVIGRLLPFRGG